MQRTTTRRALLASVAVGALAAQNPAQNPLSVGEAVHLPQKIRLGLIGLDGHYGEILGPLPRLPEVEFVAVADSNPNALNLKRFGSVHRYTDYRQMLDSEHLDVVGVCNSNGDRAAVVVACLEHKLHVAAEKPLAIERAGLERIKQAVTRNGVRLTALLPMRFDPIYIAIKQVVDSGEIGEVAQIAAQKSYKLEQRPEWYRHRATYGGTIPWIGIHMVDLMRWSSGREFTEAVSFQSRIGYPELGDMENVTGSLFRLDNGGIASLHMDFLRPETAATHGDDRLRLAGTKGVVEYQESTGVTLITGRRPPENIRSSPRARSLFVDFLESIYLGKTSALPLADVYRVNEIVLLARDSADRHQIVRL